MSLAYETVKQVNRKGISQKRNIYVSDKYDVRDVVRAATGS